MPIDVWRATPPRSLLFVPADRLERFVPNADATSTDGLVFDLEDSVHASVKNQARADLVAFLHTASLRHTFWVRVNAEDAERLVDDIAAAVQVHASGVILPKVRHAGDVARAVEHLTRNEASGAVEPLAIITLLESPAAVLHAESIASADRRVVGVGFGAEDLAADLGIARSRGGAEMFVARSQVILGAAAGGTWALDSPPMDVRDEVQAHREAARARRLGFVGQFAVHPRHVPIIHAAFTPTAAEIAWASEVFAAMRRATAAGSGTATVGGRLVDQPSFRLARRFLTRAAQANSCGTQRDDARAD
ncbi:MAG: citrate (pro-3S)-lyase subunit beta [Chloroflexota bacterium]